MWQNSPILIPLPGISHRLTVRVPCPVGEMELKIVAFDAEQITKEVAIRWYCQIGRRLASNGS
jgi:hypothetical protein